MIFNYIIVKFDIAGFHYYGGHCDYLKNYHRHNFNFKVTLRVTELNRQIEFIEYKNQCIKCINEMYPTYSVHRAYQGIDFSWRSCEMIINELLNKLPNCEDIFSIEVYEDNENGAALLRN